MVDTAESTMGPSGLPALRQQTVRSAGPARVELVEPPLPLKLAAVRARGSTLQRPVQDQLAELFAAVPSVRIVEGQDEHASAEPTTSRPAGLHEALEGEATLDRSTRAAAGVGMTAICLLLFWHVVAKLSTATEDLLVVGYTVSVTTYVVSRFTLSAFYRPPRERPGHLPSVAIIVPAYNEGEAVVRTIDACLSLDYPDDLLEVVCIDDGSADDTWEQMTAAAARHAPGAVRCIDLGTNQGKRAAMAAGIRATTAEILVFVDSDSVPAPEAVRRLVRGFADERVGAISGLTHVRNARRNLLTKMQAARYYVSFQLLKAAESVVGAVVCCSGCFAAYRRAAVVPILDEWEHQRFLGVECTYGDDRALTNMVLRCGWTTRYDASAEAWTDAPDRYGKFFRQQLRWKKSWAREGPILLTHLWRSRPVAFLPALVGSLAGAMSPIVVVWTLLYLPLAGGVLPAVYLLGLYLVAMSYSLLYRAKRNDGMWRYALVGTFFYVALSPQLLWATARIRDGSWGTRG